MKSNDKATLIAGGVIIVTGLLSYIPIVREGRKARAKIEQQKLDRLNLIHQTTERILETAATPGVTAKDLYNTINEENAFLDIVINQPYEY